MAILGGAAALEVIGLVLAALAGGHPGASLAGWLLGGVVAIVLLGVFSAVDARRRLDSWYGATAWPSAARSALCVVAIVVVAVNAWQFADWASRR